MNHGIAVRPVRPEDVPAAVAMVHELADFEQAADRCRLTPDQLRATLFRPQPALFGHVALDPAGAPVGIALWFLNFSTWEGTHGLYLEDLYVRPAARGLGAGGALLAELARVCVERGYRRMDWQVLDWNPAADFYSALGATVSSGWVPYRLSGDALHRLAERASPTSTENR